MENWNKLFILKVILIVIIFIVPVFAGCSSATPAASSSTSQAQISSSSKPIASSSSPTPKSGGILKIIYDTAHATPLGWPPEVVGASTTSPQLCFDSLLRGDSKGGVYPWLAESYKIGDDNKSITFSLRKGIKFHDGTDFNAQAAKFNLENTIAAKTQPDWISVDVIDDYSVRVNLKQLVSTTLTTFADNNYTWMISPTAFQKNGLDWVRQNPVGTGPFKFVSFARDTNFKVTRNNDYWQKGKPYLDGIEITYVTDPSTRLAAMQAGTGDAVFMNIGKASSDYAGLGLVIKTLMTTNNCLISDTANADSPFANQKVREAVEYCLDREAMAKGLGYGYWQAPYQIPGRDTVAYNSNFSLSRKYDVNKAKQLLAEAGFPNGFKTTLISAPLGRVNDINVAVQSYLSQIGIQTDVELPDLAKWNTYLMGTHQKSLLLSPVAGYANWSYTLDFYFNNPNPIRFKSLLRTPEYIKLYEAQRSSPAPSVDQLRACADYFSKEASVIPVFEGGTGWGIRPYVMDSGFNERSAPGYFKPDQLWLNK
jgi:peptide/nickel transport system substrate-binding protein